MLEVANISVRYGSFAAIRDVTFSVKRGEIAVLLGANGAGKSTLFRTISGLHKPVRGKSASMASALIRCLLTASSGAASCNARKGANCFRA
ncbi:Sulfate/thiosulfate import ATP-binding protein CysA [Geobacillus sp. BCO2]|nr:Sulfate/thiosulfate import ATP-binding protein CysA [Geobacillus sp. BCO2]